jgi:hypothetical protein
MMSPTSTLLLEFDSELDNLDEAKGKELRDGLSVVLQIGHTLWVANDETISLERLSLTQESNASTAQRGRHHQQFLLSDYLQLPEPSNQKAKETIAEVDIEGLAYEDGYLWLVGSHSLKRKKPRLDEDIKQSQKRLAKVTSDGNRYLLARIPVIESDGTYTLTKAITQNGKQHTAAQLHGNKKGNDLTKALRKDKHLKHFLPIPGKDNGFDIEGLAVVGDRILLGLRGPVLRGWAVILELALEQDDKQPSTLRLKEIGPDNRLYRKHFLDLGGLGIRELCVDGSDLLILAGPTMALDGPVTVFRWRNGAKIPAEAMVPSSELEHVLDIPYGKTVDHAEGMTLFSTDDEKSQSLLVVYDSASESRQLESSILAADIFSL